jgi:hypothetical protein
MNYDQVIKSIKSVSERFPINIFGKRADAIDRLGFLYRCGFVSARQEVSTSKYKHLEYEDAPALLYARVGIEHFDWEIHPAFRPHLETIQVSAFHIAALKGKRRKQRGH